MFQLYFLITLNCNLKCGHCIRKYNDRFFISSMSIDDCKKYIAYLKKQLPTKTNFIVSGGEPTLHSDFLNFLEIIVNSFSTVTINSNGSVTNSILDGIVKIAPQSVVQISLDGNLNIHNKIRGYGAFEKALETIDYLNANKHRVVVSTTVSKRNISSIFELAEKLSVYPDVIWKISPEQIFSKDRMKDQIFSEEWNFFVDEILQKAKNRLSIKKLFDFNLFDKMREKYGMEFLIKNSTANCGLGSSKLYVYPDGSLIPCTCMTNLNLGNLNNYDNKNLLEELNKKSPMIAKENEVCSVCEWASLCKGGCPGYSFHHLGRLGLGDIRCPKIKNYYGL